MLRFRVMGVAMLAGAVLAAPAVAGQDKPDNSKEKESCRVYRATGSIMRKRVCHTAEQWRAIDAKNNDDARRGIDLSRRSGGPPSE